MSLTPMGNTPAGPPVEVLDADVGDLELLLPDARQLGGAEAQLAQQQLQRGALVVAVPRCRVHVPAPRWEPGQLGHQDDGFVLIRYHHEPMSVALTFTLITFELTRSAVMQAQQCKVEGPSDEATVDPIARSGGC